MAYALDCGNPPFMPSWAMEGYNSRLQGWVLPRPINPHAHFRCPQTQREMFDLVVPETAKIYRWATAMPNLQKHRIKTPAQAFEYRRLIQECGKPHNPRFDVTVPFYIEADLDPLVVEDGFHLNAWVAGKLYPKNGTTNSAEGVDFRNISGLWPLFSRMQRLGALLLVHGEVVTFEDGRLVPDRDRETLAISVVQEILEAFPRLKVVFEHISSKATVEAVIRWQDHGYAVEATIAPQYLLWNSTVLFQGGMNPINFSIPILKDEEDRLAILDFMLNGRGMLGTDTAPHDITRKSQHIGCPGGVFNEPVGLFVYFHMFRRYGGEGWFNRFREFACYRAAKFYGLPSASPTDRVLITDGETVIPELYTNGTTRVVPMFAGMVVPYGFKAL